MNETFDLVVIGSGTGALGTAVRCARAGWKVALTDELPFGGTCALRGCDPKKMLVASSEALDFSRRMAGRGLDSDGERLNWPDMIAFKRTFVDGVPADRESWLKKEGVQTFHDAARFVGPDTLTIGEREVRAGHVHIATGARPATLGIPGESELITSTEFLDLKSLPARLVFVGGGYIAFEFAHIAARAGAQVTIMHRGARPLKGFDPDLVDLLVERTRKLGIHVLLGASVAAIAKTGNGYRVDCKGKGDRSVEADLVVHAAGRTPNLDALDLDAANVEFGTEGVMVNAFLQSVSNPRVYAAGDCAATGRPALTPVAGFEGRIAAQNMLEGNTQKALDKPFPSAVFTVPPLARVGMLESEARERGLSVRAKFQEIGSWYSARRVAEEAVAFKTLVEEGSGRLLGAHVLGPNAEEVINLFSMAMSAGLSTEVIKNVSFAYPSFASDIGYMV